MTSSKSHAAFKGVVNATSKLVRAAWAKFPAGIHRPRIVDRCIFNYQREPPKEIQTGWKCAADFTCSDIINFHKGHGDDHKHAAKRTEWVDKFGNDIIACVKPKVQSALPAGVE